MTLASLPLWGVACIGEDPFSSLGGGGPSPDNDNVLSFQAAFGGSTHGCALVNGGRALCWGSGGDLGDGTQEASETPVRVQGPQTFARLDLSSFSCGVTTNGQAWCWGENTDGRLGDGTTDRQLVPTAVATAERFTHVSPGGVHACGLVTDQSILCWGSNRFQQLLSHPDTMSATPLAIGAGTSFRELDAGGLQTCAIDVSDAIHCWGGPWGAAFTTIPGTPVLTQLSVGEQHACGLTADGEAFCFGENTEGQLGDGTFVSPPLGSAPTPVLTDLRFTALSSGSFHTCALEVEGDVYCWGRDDLGQLGDGDPPNGSDPPRKALPSRVAAPNSFIDFATVSAGRFISCATTPDGDGYCWGFGTGSASQSFSTSPVLLGS